MIKIGKSYIIRGHGYSKLCADVKIGEKDINIYFMVESTQEEYLCIGRADAFVMSILPIAISEGHEIICEDVISERLHYQLNEYLIPTLIFEKGKIPLIRVKASLTAEPYPNQGAVGTLFSDDVDSLYTIMKHCGKSEYPLSYIAVFNSGVFEGEEYRKVFHDNCRQAMFFAREHGLKTVSVDTNFHEVFQESFQSVSSFRNLACALAIQGLFSIYLMTSVCDATQFKIDFEYASRYDLLTASFVSTESMSVYLSGFEVGYEKKLWNIREGEMSGKWVSADEERNFIKVGKPYLTKSAGRVYLQAEIWMYGKEQVMWFSVKSSYGEYLVEDRADAFVVGLLTTAMRNDMDLVCEAPVTRRLLYQINHYLIPVMTENMEEYHYIRVFAEPTDVVLKCVGAVGTGWTGGVDCTFTYARHFQIEDVRHKITHLLISNNGALEGRTRETLSKMTEKAETGFAAEAGLDVVDADTNIQEILSEAFISVAAFRHGAVALALQKLFGVFLVSSGENFTHFAFDAKVGSFYEMETFGCLETDCTVSYSAGGAFSRIQKLEELSDLPLARKYLHPCIYALRKNCGKCDKCIKTESALYGLGMLRKFSDVFDVEEFNQNKEWYFKNLMLNRKSVHCVEVLNLLEHEVGSLISIIIPVYNSELYIRDCIQSIQEQRYFNIEVIMIDDGSVDQSREICEEVSRTDQRFKILSQEHKGVSAARNAGLREAKGKYLFFLDSDDMIHPELLETLYKLLEKSNAVMATEYYCRDEEEFYNMYSNKADGFHSLKYTYLKNENMLWEFLMYGAQGGIGGKMIRSTAAQFREFDEKLVTGEDTKFIYQVIAGGADAVILYQDWYYYRKNEENVRKKNTVRAWQSIYESMRYICNNERKYGRMINSIRCEEHIIRCMMGWNLLNRQMQDHRIAEYLKKKAEMERRLKIFSKINWHVKKDFYLMFYCYPAYRLNRKLTSIWGKDEGAWDAHNKSRIQDEHVKKNREYVEKISIIIPVYNSEAFVKRCIRSIIEQSYSNLEIIVIDDGSTDRSLEICEELKASDDRIRIYAQENEGAASTRNRGLDIATGKYVFFLDSDDAIHPLLLEELLWQAEDDHAEMALCEYSKLYAVWMEEALDGLSEKDERPKWEIIEKTEAENWFHKRYYDSFVRVGVLIRRDFIGAIRFKKGLLYGADALFLYHLICKQPRIIYSAKEWYYHRIYSGERVFEDIKDKRYFDIYRIIRDEEYHRGNQDIALLWERRLIWMIRQKFVLMEGKEEQCRVLKKQALMEKRHPLFRKVSVTAKVLFLCCFSFYPLYSVLGKPIKILDKMAWFVKSITSKAKGDSE